MYPLYNIHTHYRKGASLPTHSVVSLTPQELSEGKGEGVPHLSISIHPWEVAQPTFVYPTPTQWHNWLTLPSVVALGECGVDASIATPIAVQMAYFAQQVALSELYCKPLIIHCVRAYHLLLQLHKELHPQQAWIVHGFRGNPTLAQQLQARGIYLAIGERFNPLSLATIDPQRLLLESDESPLAIADIYHRVALALDRPLWWVEQVVAESVERLFHGALG